MTAQATLLPRLNHKPMPASGVGGRARSSFIWKSLENRSDEAAMCELDFIWCQGLWSSFCWCSQSVFKLFRSIALTCCRKPSKRSIVRRMKAFAASLSSGRMAFRVFNFDCNLHFYVSVYTMAFHKVMSAPGSPACLTCLQKTLASLCASIVPGMMQPSSCARKFQERNQHLSLAPK